MTGRLPRPVSMLDPDAVSVLSLMQVLPLPKSWGKLYVIILMGFCCELTRTSLSQVDENMEPCVNGRVQ